MFICPELINILALERIDLCKEIEKNMWYMGEKLHRKVSWEEAALDYVKNYLHPWAEGYRQCYCRNVCRFKNGCIGADKITP